MKIVKKIFDKFKGIDEAGKRFPISLTLAVLFVVVRIYMNEMDASFSSNLMEKLNRISMILAMGIPLSLVIGLIIERFLKKDRLKATIFYGLGLLFLFFYYYFLLLDLNYVSIVRYTGMLMFLIISFFYVSRIRLKEDYEKYVIHVFSQIFLTALYSLVLLLGTYFILFTVDQLFDIDVKWKYYYYVFLIISMIFAVAFFLSKLPKPFEDFKDKTYSKSLRILLAYIVIPLISIYTFILYLYFGKILIQKDWPKGLVSHLVLWYSAVSVGVIFLITPVVEEDKICKKFKDLFPKVILPILLMMFISIGIRIRNYGITENRYYVVALGIWVTAMMIYISIRGTKRNILIPLTLSLILLNSVFGPLSSFAISKYSQNKRFVNILEANNMIEGKQIIKNSNIDEESKKEINNILEYFEGSHSFDDVKYIKKGFNLNQMKEVFGFEYTSSGNYYYDEYFNHQRYVGIESLEVTGYDYFVDMKYLDEGLGTRIKNLLIKQGPEGVLSIVREEEILFEEDLKLIGKSLYDEFGSKENGKYERSIEEMTYEFEDSGIKIKLIFNEISGRIEKDTRNISIENFSYILFIKVK